MFSAEINKVLSRDSVTKSFFRGCFPADRIPYLNDFPYCMVVNTDCAGSPGTHWTALYVDSANHIEYYDSFGAWPPPLEISEYLDKFKFVKLNQLKLQSDRAASCGRHVIYFLRRRCSGLAFSEIIKNFVDCKSNPDELVNSYLHSFLENRAN